METWCEYCEDELNESFSVINGVHIKDNEQSNASSHGIIWWNRSTLKPSAHSKVFLLLTELYFCDCCERHQHNKPCVPNHWVSTTNISPTHFDDQCMCDCRFISRMICRSWNN
jgi:hypothetical protein